MMKAIVLLSAAFAARTLAQGSQSKADPPNHYQPGPQYYIYQDVDYVAAPAGNLSACQPVHALRSKCYKAGVNAKDLKAEWECLCSADAAYAVTQCFASEFQNLNTSAAQDNYYTKFLDYTYDCYCGVTGYDVTYNRTVNPPRPFINGFTGDAMLPPVGGCPKPNPPPTPPPPTPPCGCVPPPLPPQPPCPTGYHRVNKCCVPNPPPCQPCKAPKELDSQGQCVCPWYLEPAGDSCRWPQCPGYPLEVFINGCYGGYCTCVPGYEYNQFGQCVEICGWGEISDGNGGCTPCQSPLIPDYDGNCVCPEAYGYIIVDGECVLGCPDNEIFSYANGGCYCPSDFYYNSEGECVPLLCDDWTASCRPGYPGIANATGFLQVSVVSESQSFSSYVPTTTYNESLYTQTLTAPEITSLPPTLVPTSTPTVETTIPVNGTNATTTTDVLSTTSLESNTTSLETATSTTTDDLSTTTDISSSTTIDSTTSSDEGPTSTPDSGGGGGDATSTADFVTPTGNGGGSGDGGSGDGGSGDGGSGGGSDGSGGGGGSETPTARVKVRRQGRQMRQWN